MTLQSVRQVVGRFEDWGIDHLDSVVVFAAVFNVVALLIVVTLAVLT